MNKKIALLFIAGIVVLGAVGAIMLLSSGKNSRINQKTTETTIVPTKEVEFVVVRVLPSGFVPSEVTIKKGMIVRFTNPLKNKVLLKWEGATQYTSEAVFEGNDISTAPFDTEGVYTYNDDATKPHSGKVTVR